MDQAFRNKRIHEVLGVEKPVKKKLSPPRLSGISKEDAGALSGTMDTVELQKLNVFVSNLRKSLNSKAASAKQVATEWLKSKTFDKQMLNVTSVEELTSTYNYVVGIYLKLGNAYNTRQTMKSVLVSMHGPVDNIVDYMSATMHKAVGPYQAGPFTRALSVYRAIQKQMRSGDFRLLTTTSLVQEKKAIIGDTTYKTNRSPMVDFGEPGYYPGRNQQPPPPTAALRVHQGLSIQSIHRAECSLAICKSVLQLRSLHAKRVLPNVHESSRDSPPALQV